MVLNIYLPRFPCAYPVGQWYINDVQNLLLHYMAMYTEIAFHEVKYKAEMSILFTFKGMEEKMF